MSEHALADKARSLGLGKYLLLAHGEEHAGGRTLDSLLSDALEAVIGAMYLQVGYGTCRDFLLDLLGEEVQILWDSKDFIDPKSALQEKVQQYSHSTPIYDVLEQALITTNLPRGWQARRHPGKGRGKVRKMRNRLLPPLSRPCREDWHILVVQYVSTLFEWFFRPFGSIYSRQAIYDTVYRWTR